MPPLGEATFSGRGWSAIPMEESHAAAVEKLFAACEDYFVLISGREPGPAEVQSAFTALPEGKTYADKFPFVLTDDSGEVFGQLDVIRDYPGAREWWIGLLLIDPTRRSRGLGTDIYHGIAAWARDHGAKGMRLSVVEQNQAALRFWRRLGFAEIERVSGHRQGMLDNVAIVMRAPV